jgi:hypothetical protein
LLPGHRTAQVGKSPSGRHQDWLILVHVMQEKDPAFKTADLVGDLIHIQAAGYTR